MVNGFYVSGDTLSSDIWWMTKFTFSSADISMSHSSWLLCVSDSNTEAKKTTSACTYYTNMESLTFLRNRETVTDLWL